MATQNVKNLLVGAVVGAAVGVAPSASPGVRGVLLRVLFDDDFHAQVVVSPEEALAQYVLTDEERQALASPGGALRGLLAAHAASPADASGGPIAAQEPQPPTVVVVTTTTVTVTTTTTTTTTTATVTTATVSPGGGMFSAMAPPSDAELAVAVEAVRGSRGAERIERILGLIERIEGTRG